VHLKTAGTSYLEPSGSLQGVIPDCFAGSWHSPWNVTRETERVITSPQIPRGNGSGRA